jgi:DnaJ-class molecular chaperone
MNREASTMSQCERCDGKGGKQRSIEYGTTYAVHGEAECWLCRGTGMVTPLRLHSWNRAGRPVEKPADWVV